jgi:hypothetical protein
MELCVCLAPGLLSTAWLVCQEECIYMLLGGGGRSSGGVDWKFYRSILSMCIIRSTEFSSQSCYYSPDGLLRPTASLLLALTYTYGTLPRIFHTDTKSEQAPVFKEGMKAQPINSLHVSPWKFREPKPAVGLGLSPASCRSRQVTVEL